MTYHFKHSEVSKLVQANEAVLLTGERGTGKTTLAMDVAKHLKLTFYSMSMTRQTTLSHLLGFMNVNGIYIPSQIRLASEQGGLVLLDELDASDPNVLLCLNTIENGYLSFPDKVVTLHKDFRLAATCNPQDNHKDYNGRAKLDAATLDRFDKIDIERDEDLEKSLVDFNTYTHMQLVRKCLKEQNSSLYISMRDSLRYQKRKNLGLLDNFIENLLKKEYSALEEYKRLSAYLPTNSEISECKTINEVWKFAMNTNTTQN
jgi:MoxR-like ATPase